MTPFTECCAGGDGGDTLEGTPYSRSFLLGLPHNAALLAAAEGYGCIPPEIDKLIRQA